MEKPDPSPGPSSEFVRSKSLPPAGKVSPSGTDYMSPFSNQSGFDSVADSPVVDWGRHSKFTPGKYTIKERLQLLQNRFDKLNQDVS